jgi:hypothetical protein
MVLEFLDHEFPGLIAGKGIVESVEELDETVFFGGWCAE